MKPSVTDRVKFSHLFPELSTSPQETLVNTPCFAPFNPMYAAC